MVKKSLPTYFQYLMTKVIKWNTLTIPTEGIVALHNMDIEVLLCKLN